MSNAFQKLKEARDALNNCEDYSHAYQDAYDKCEAEFEKEKVESEPLPKCCEQIKQFPIVRLTLSNLDNTELSDAYWAIYTGYKTQDFLFKAAGHEYFKNIVEVKFCPFCSTELPKVKRKNPVPKDICVIKDGGYYCHNCESSRSCICKEPQACFEVI